jgi:hypothetical protein
MRGRETLEFQVPQEAVAEHEDRVAVPFEERADVNRDAGACVVRWGGDALTSSTMSGLETRSHEGRWRNGSWTSTTINALFMSPWWHGEQRRPRPDPDDLRTDLVTVGYEEQCSLAVSTSSSATQTTRHHWSCPCTVSSNEGPWRGSCAMREWLLTSCANSSSHRSGRTAPVPCTVVTKITNWVVGVALEKPLEYKLPVGSNPTPLRC